jgi:hypothetical protein
MSSLFTGSLLEELDPLPKWSARSGPILVRRWKGVPAEVDVVAQQATALGYDWDTDYDGPYKILRVDYPENTDQSVDTPLSDDWELERNLIQNDLWTMPEIRAEFEKLSIFDDALLAMNLIRKDIENLIDGQPYTNKPVFDSSGNLSEWEENVILSVSYIKANIEATGLNFEPFGQLIQSMAKGVRFRSISTWVLTRDIVTQKRSQIIASDVGVNTIYSTTNLKAIEQINDADIKFRMPPDGYWLKIVPKVSKIEKGKWRIHREWWHADDYDRWVYKETTA